MQTTSTHSSSTSPGRVLLWIGLTLSLVVGGMFLAVAMTNSGDTETGGLMVAIPCALVAALCAFGLSRVRRDH